MKVSCIIFLFLLLCSCNTNVHGQKNGQTTVSNTSADDYRKILEEREKSESKKNNDTLGQLISKVDFNVKTYDTIKNKEEITSMIELSRPDIDHLVQKNEIVITENRVTIIIDYPLKNAYITELTSNKGFTRENLIIAIQKMYHDIYEEEEASATVKTIPAEKRTTMYNRNETNGKYGIWGHDISDLVLTSIWVYKNQSGKIFLSLQIDS